MASCSVRLNDETLQASFQAPKVQFKTMNLKSALVIRGQVVPCHYEQGGFKLESSNGRRYDQKDD